MKLQHLTEGVSPILYHLTSLRGISEILQADKFRLSASFSNDSEYEVGSTKQFFLSTTRSKIGGYTMRSSGNQSVVLVLDGRALAQRYTGGPVQYFSKDFIQHNNYYDEMEDRIYADTPFIPNASSYIREMHVLIKDMSIQGRRAILMMKKSGIPVFYYDDERTFQLQNKAKAKPLSAFTIPKADADDHKRWPSVDRLASRKQERRRERQAGNKNKISYGLDRWIEFMTRPVEQWDQMHYSKKNFLRSLQYGIEDANRSLSADLHNAKNSPSEIGPMAKLMTKYKLRTSKDIVQFIKDRWASAVSA